MGAARSRLGIADDISPSKLAGINGPQQSRWCDWRGGGYRGFRPACLHPRLLSLTHSGSQVGQASGLTILWKDVAGRDYQGCGRFHLTPAADENQGFVQRPVAYKTFFSVWLRRRRKARDGQEPVMAAADREPSMGGRDERRWGQRVATRRGWR